MALAGRNMKKLEDVRDRVRPARPDAAELPLLKADVNDADSLRTIAESAKVVITTVGPYITYGEPLVAACAAAGTHYVDLTGEPLFVDLMWLRHHETAERSGAKIVHSCGFDSIPYDLGALFTVDQLPENAQIKLEGFVRVGGTFSGGTYQSALEIMGRLGESVRVARQRRQREPKPTGTQGQGRARRATPRRLGRRVGGPVSHDRPADRPALGPRARALRTRFHLQPLPRGQTTPGSGRHGDGSGISGRAGPDPARAQGADENQELG